MSFDPVRPPYVAGSYGDVLADFRDNVKLTAEEMDEIIFNHNFTRESLNETYRLLKVLWNYHMRSSGDKTQ